MAVERIQLLLLPLGGLACLCLLALFLLFDSRSRCARLLDFVRGELPRAWRAVFAAASGCGVVGALTGGGVCSAHAIEAFGFGAVTLDFAIATVE